MRELQEGKHDKKCEARDDSLGFDRVGRWTHPDKGGRTIYEAIMYNSANAGRCVKIARLEAITRLDAAQMTVAVPHMQTEQAARLEKSIAAFRKVCMSK